MISYPILCVSNQHIGGYHGSHGSKWIFGLIPPSWISRSVTFVLPACDLLSLIMNTLFFFVAFFYITPFFFHMPRAVFCCDFRAKCSAGFHSTCSVTSLSSTRLNREAELFRENLQGPAKSWLLMPSHKRSVHSKKQKTTWTFKSI